MFRRDVLIRDRRYTERELKHMARELKRLHPGSQVARLFQSKRKVDKSNAR